MSETLNGLKFFRPAQDSLLDLGISLSVCMYGNNLIFKKNGVLNSLLLRNSTLHCMLVVICACMHGGGVCAHVCMMWRTKRTPYIILQTPAIMFALVYLLLVYSYLLLFILFSLWPRACQIGWPGSEHQCSI